MRVKICGINDPASFDAAVSSAADWIGFVFFARSPRAVTPAQARVLDRRHAGGPLRVGLFVDPTEAEVDAALDAVSLDVLQLYATADRVEALRELFGIPVWHAVGVSDRADLPRSTGADGLVIESKPPPGSTRPGGNASALDWSLLAGWHAPVPWLMAGGLTPENVAEAIAASGAGAVDVSSGVEIAPGVKDAARIAAFIGAARAAGVATGAAIWRVLP